MTPPTGPVLRAAHTADLDEHDRQAVRALLDDVFEGDLDEHDHEHALGGVHLLLNEGDDLVGHASVVQRRLLHAGRAVRTGYVEAVAVRSDRRRRGYGDRLMAAAERVVHRAYDLGALSSTEQALPFYASRGWQLWEGPTAVLTPDGVRRTPDDDGGVLVLAVPGSPVTGLDPTGTLTCDWRDGDVW